MGVAGRSGRAARLLLLLGRLSAFLQAAATRRQNSQHAAAMACGCFQTEATLHVAARCCQQRLDEVFPSLHIAAYHPQKCTRRRD